MVHQHTASSHTSLPQSLPSPRSAAHFERSADAERPRSSARPLDATAPRDEAGLSTSVTASHDLDDVTDVLVGNVDGAAILRDREALRVPHGEGRAERRVRARRQIDDVRLFRSGIVADDCRRFVL